MENVLKLLRAACYILLFDLAITQLFHLSGKYKNLIAFSAEHIIDDNMMHETYLNEETHDVSRAELICILMSEPEFDLCIIDLSGTYAVIKGEYDPVNIEAYPLQSYKFTKTYEYDQNGLITQINYKYIE